MKDQNRQINELVEALQKVVNRSTRITHRDSSGQDMVSIRAALIDECRAVLAKVQS